MDDLALRALRTRGHGSYIERPILRYSSMGEHGGLWLAMSGAGALVDRPRRGAYLRAAATILLAYAVNQAIKFTVRRGRPQLPGLPPLINTQSQRSYPSAHASTSFAAARTLGRIWPAEPLYMLAAVMALSRPYLGVHYPSDVIAGAALGTAIAELSAA